MLSLIALAATVGGYPQASYAATGYGYGARSYTATPYIQTYNYGTTYAPNYSHKIVTAFVPNVQYDQYRVEIVGDAARAQAYAQQRLAADANLVNAINNFGATLDKFRAQVAQATQSQEQAFQAKQQAQTQVPPPPAAQYPVQPSPQQPPDYAAPPPPVSLQAPPKATPSLPPVNVPPPPTDASQDQQGTFPTQPQGPTGFQSQPSGPLSPAMQAATAVISQRCGSCHGPNGSGGLAILASKDRLARYDADFLRMLAQVTYRGYVLKPDGAKLKMPPNGRGVSAEEFAPVMAAADEADQAATLASNGQGGR